MKKYNTNFLLIFLLCPLTTQSRDGFISIAEDNTQLFSGETISRTLIIQDLPPRRKLKCIWKTLIEMAVIEKGETPIKQDEGGEARVRIILHLPRVTRQVKLIWVVEIKSEGELLGADVFQYRIFPRDNAAILKEVLWGRKIGIFDPAGELRELFSSLGISYSDLSNDLSLKLFRGDALIIGPGAVSNPWSTLFQLLDSEIPFAGGVLCLRQSKFPDGLPIKILSDISTGAGDPTAMAPNHPVLFGLTADDFRGWRRQDDLALTLNKPFRGNYRSLLDLPLRGGERRGSLLLENLLGGRPVLFCQLPVCRLYRSNPMAGILLTNMLRFIVRSSRPASSSHR